MASHNISIRGNLYKKLTLLKQSNQSYSEVIEGLLDEGSKGSFSRLMKYFGIWADYPDEIFQTRSDELGSTREGLNQSMNSRIQERMRKLE